MTEQTPRIMYETLILVRLCMAFHRKIVAEAVRRPQLKKKKKCLFVNSVEMSEVHGGVAWRLYCCHLNTND